MTRARIIQRDSERQGESKKPLDAIKDLLARCPEVSFAYLFGSRARGATGPLSDIDVAVFLDRQVETFTFRLRLMEKLAQVLGAERFDLVTLNDAPPVLRYEVIREGQVIKENKRSRIEFEARTLGEYLDTAHMRSVQQDYLKKQLGEPLGQ